jgi:hypothetical protein
VRTSNPIIYTNSVWIRLSSKRTKHILYINVHNSEIDLKWQ